MSEFDQKQYRTVILAGLLHDIGKFMQRVKGRRFPGDHEDIGADLIGRKNRFESDADKEGFRSFVSSIRPDWFDLDLLESAVRGHHKKALQPTTTIVHKADSYSTKERFEPDDKMQDYLGGRKFEPLKSIFAFVDLGNRGDIETYAYTGDILNSFSSFPEKDKKKLGAYDSSLLCDGLSAELGKVDSSNATFEHYFQTLCAILEKYTWCLPCHANPAVADVSIFDHLRSTSAIAACLFQYHRETDTFDSDNIDNDEPKKFLLVGGDLSGIQKYIYQIAAITGEGGVAKRLRARSFYISALVEATVIKLLQALGLPVVCNLVSAGGHFVILAPNTSSAKAVLKAQAQEISQWLLENFSGELALNLDWSVTLRGDDFYRRKGWMETERGPEEPDPAQFRECNYRDRIDGLRWQLDSAKQRGFEPVLVGENGWNQDAFVLRRQYNGYAEGRSDCKSCRKFPATMPDPHERNESVQEEILCTKCFTDKILGRLLLDAEYLVIGKAQNTSTLSQDSKLFYFYDDHYFIKPQSNDQTANSLPNNHQVIVIQRLRDHHGENKPLPMGAVHRFMANYAPFFEPGDSMELCKRCKSDGTCDIKAPTGKANEKRRLLTFECLAAAGCEPPKQDGQVQGSALLGVLKADVDNLGLIFSQGLGNRVTVSRYLTLSRMIDLFFSGWVYRILKEEPVFKHIYTVYSGGDDVVLVGPWQAILFFAGRLNREFRRFTCQNHDITLSAGIAVVHPKHPISDAVARAELNLNKSKTAGKNRLTLFGTTIEWREYPVLSDCATILHENHQRFPDIFTTAFMHRLLTYHKMYLNTQAGRIHDLIFLARMHNDVKRNLIERLEATKRKNQRDEAFQEKAALFQDEIIDGLMQSLQHCTVNSCLMRNLKIPLFWTLYRNRTFSTRRQANER